MPSDYAKWLQRDVEKNVAAEYTRTQKLKNWWNYHKWLVLGGVVLLAIVIELVANALGIGQTQPDYQVAYVGAYTLEDETVQEIVQWLEAMGEGLKRRRPGGGPAQPVPLPERPVWSSRHRRRFPRDS